MQNFGPDDADREEPRDDDWDQEEDHLRDEPPGEFSSPDSLSAFQFHSAAPGESPDAETSSRDARLRRQWALNDSIKSHFVINPGDSAERFLQVFNADCLHAYVHRELGHSKGAPVHAMHIADSQKEFMSLLNSNVQIFLDAKPSAAQIRQFLSIPTDLKLTTGQLREYSGLNELGDAPHGMTDYYWYKAADYVYDTIVPSVEQPGDLIALTEVEWPEVEDMNFGRPTRAALLDIVGRGFEIGGPDPGWMHRLKGLDDLVASAGAEHPLGLLKELILDENSAHFDDATRASHVINVLSGDYLQERLLAGTNGGETFGRKLDGFLRQSVTKEAPEDAIRFELRWQREFLFRYLMGRQQSGCELTAPRSESEMRAFRSAAEMSGYEVSACDGKLTLRPNAIENYGEDLRSIASNLRKRLREAPFESAAEFVACFDPSRLPRIKAIPHQEYQDPSAAKVHERKLQELLGVVFFEELAAQLPRLHQLNPSAREVRALLELQTKMPFDIRYNQDACRAHDEMMWDLFDRYLGNAQTIQDWTAVATYRTVPAAEYEWQQRAAYNEYFWKAVELGDAGLMWMANDVWGNRMLNSKFNESNTIRSAFDDLADYERTDQHMIRRAISLIQGGFLREQAREKIADDPINGLKVALASAMFGIPKEEFDPKQVDEKDLDRVERHQKGVLMKFLAAREKAGAEISVPNSVFASFSENAGKLGFQVTAVGNRAPDGDATVVKIQPAPPSSLRQAITMGAELLSKATSAPLRFIREELRIRRRGWR